MSDVIEIRKRKINVKNAENLVNQGDELEALKFLRSQFAGITGDEKLVSRKVLTRIKNSDSISENDIKQIINECETTAAKRKLNTAINKSEKKAIPNANKNTPHCPTCSSTNIESLGAGTRIAAGAMFGLFSKTARSQFRCKNCGYKW